MEIVVDGQVMPQHLPHMLHIPVTDKVKPDNIRQVPFISITRDATAVMAALAGLAEIPGAHA